MGEMVFEQKALVTAIDDALQEQVEAAEELRLTTPGGRFQVRLDEEGSATALGQLAFFAEFLDVSGLFARWVEGLPDIIPPPGSEGLAMPEGTIRLGAEIVACPPWKQARKPARYAH